jgi:hypothetical protein
MDGQEAVYDAESARVWDGVLVLLKGVRVREGTPVPAMGSVLRKRRNLPVDNIREWSDDSS